MNSETYPGKVHKNYMLMRRSCIATAGNDDGDGSENENGPIIESTAEHEAQGRIVTAGSYPAPRLLLGGRDFALHKKAPPDQMSNEGVNSMRNAAAANLAAEAVADDHVGGPTQLCNYFDDICCSSSNSVRTGSGRRAVWRNY
jgi:hypothetical protein